MDLIIFGVILLSLVLAGFIKGFSGFGTSIVLTGIMLFYYDPAYIIPVAALLSIVLNIFLLVEHAPHLKTVKDNFALQPATLISLLVGTYVGVKLLLVLNVNIIKIIFAIFILLFLYSIRHKVKTHSTFKPSKTTVNVLIGLVSGFFSGLINVNGPAPTMFALYHKYNKVKMLKAIVIFFFIADLITIILFWMNGMYYTESIKLFLMFIPFVVLGFLGGMYARQQVHDTTFKKMVVGLLVLVAIRLFFAGLF